MTKDRAVEDQVRAAARLSPKNRRTATTVTALDPIDSGYEPTPGQFDPEPAAFEPASFEPTAPGSHDETYRDDPVPGALTGGALDQATESSAPSWMTDQTTINPDEPACTEADVIRQEEQAQPAPNAWLSDESSSLGIDLADYDEPMPQPRPFSADVDPNATHFFGADGELEAPARRRPAVSFEFDDKPTPTPTNFPSAETDIGNPPDPNETWAASEGAGAADLTPTPPIRNFDPSLAALAEELESDEAMGRPWQPRRKPAGPAALEAALNRQDNPEALRIYDDLRMLDRIHETTPLQDLLIGRLLYMWDRHFDAACACKMARDKDKKGQWAPRALYLQARIMGGHLEMRVEAVELLRKCVDRYPLDPFSGKAQNLLDRYMEEAATASSSSVVA